MNKWKAICLVMVVLVLLLGGVTLPLYSQQSNQGICVSKPATGNDIFSVGEVRTSILVEEAFQEVNGAEWVLMNGRILAVKTELSPHISQTNSQEHPIIPDARGRFLRMANNGACNGLRDSDEEYQSCLAERDPEGERPTGHVQDDNVGAHLHYYRGDRAHNTTSADRGDDIKVLWQHGDWYQNSERTTHNNPDGETRPKNIAVNYYIKICNCRTQDCR